MATENKRKMNWLKLQAKTARELGEEKLAKQLERRIADMSKGNEEVVMAVTMKDGANGDRIAVQIPFIFHKGRRYALNQSLKAVDESRAWDSKRKVWTFSGNTGVFAKVRAVLGDFFSEAKLVNAETGVSMGRLPKSTYNPG